MTSLEGYSLSIKTSTDPKHTRRPTRMSDTCFCLVWKGFEGPRWNFSGSLERFIPIDPFTSKRHRPFGLWGNTAGQWLLRSLKNGSALSLVHTLNENKMCVKGEITQEWLVSKSSNPKSSILLFSHNKSVWTFWLNFGRLYFGIYFSPTSFLQICSAKL